VWLRGSLTNEQVVCALYDEARLHARPPGRLVYTVPTSYCILALCDFSDPLYPGELVLHDWSRHPLIGYLHFLGLQHHDFDSTGVHPSVMDDSNGQAIPYQALSVAIPVMVLSIISLLLSLIWFTMQQYHSERWSCMASQERQLCLTNRTC
jgi:hypothetical protein